MASRMVSRLFQPMRKPGEWLCPICLAKLTWATGTEPIGRYRRLAAFCRENGLVEEAEFFRRSIEVLEGDVLVE